MGKGWNMRRFIFTVQEAAQMIMDAIEQRDQLNDKILAKK
jgi:FlaA1/EpsC-like NDP-sugar epimerase